MAGGTWTVQNKVRPGVYVNIESQSGSLAAMGDRGIVSLPLSLSWGPSKQVLSIEAGQDVSTMLGYSLADPALLLLREAFKRARTVLLYRLNEGSQATLTAGNLTATAKYGGARGNDLTLVVANNVDNEQLFDVRTFLSGEEVDRQTVADSSNLLSNDWLDFSGTGAPEITAGAPLTGGSDGSVTAQDHSDFLVAIEAYDFNVIGLTAQDTAVKAVYASFIRRLRENEGKYVQVVMSNYPTANYEGVISVKNGVVLADGTTLDAAKTVAWVAAATAGANVNQSLTYTAYEGAVDVSDRYTNSQIIAALQAGEFLFVSNNGRVIVEQDINTFVSFEPKKGRERSKNRVIRVLDGLANDFKRTFDNFYIGKVDNNEDGRDLLQTELVTIINAYQGIRAVQNFDAQTDISVQPGEASDSVLIEASIQPVDAIEKIYMIVRVG